MAPVLLGDESDICSMIRIILKPRNGLRPGIELVSGGSLHAG